LFCPTGTMSNQIAIKVHTRPGDEVICEEQAHVYIYEGGGIAFHSGSQVKAIKGDRGRINAEQIKKAINPDDIHKARTSLICLENTSNRGGGSCYDWEEMEFIKEVSSGNNLGLHLDGARIFNALVATGQNAKSYGSIFDSISVCFNKGMGCPMGSVLIGSKEFIKQARRVRKVFGGGMRQAGYMASACTYALSHHYNRLADDHKNAKQLGVVLEGLDYVGDLMPIETNIVIFEVKGRLSAADLSTLLKEKGIYCMAISPTQIRMVTHLGVTNDMIKYVSEVLKCI
jgi:threonine aldolase